MSDSQVMPSEIKNTRFLDGTILIVLSLNIGMALALRFFGSQMYPFFIIVYLWIPIYALSLTLLLRRDRLSHRPVVRGPIGIGIVMGLTLGIRAVFLGLTEYISLDPLWYLDFGKFMINGNLPYADFYFPYPPVFGYVIYLLGLIFPSVDGFRIFAILLDTALIPLIWKLTKRQAGERWASIAIVAYAILPISVLESGWNGHFEPLVNLFLLLSFWFLFDSRYRLSGLFLGLAVATKIYPILVLPIFFFYVKDWRSRFELTLSAAIVGAITFLPFYMPTLLREPIGTADSSPIPSSGLIDSLLGYILNPDFSGILISGFIFFCVVFGMFLMRRQIAKGQVDSNGRAYNFLTLLLGSLLILLGITAGIYAILPISRLVYWRYAPDVGFVRGITAVAMGVIVIATAAKKWKTKTENSVQIDSLLILISATLLLLIALSRDVFYGWYLLWSIPLFLLLKDRRLALTVILCLLLVYPSYTHDNFVSLGFEEERLWSDDMIEVNGWTTYINTTTSLANSSVVSAGVRSADNNSAGLFWFDTSDVEQGQLENLTIEYSLNVEAFLDANIEFVARILSEWDPTFGRYADLGLEFEGTDQNGNDTNGEIIGRSSMFTNLTYILWRSSLTTIIGVENITIHRLTLVVYPMESVKSGYILDYMYTTNYGILNPLYFVMVPSLIALALVAFTFLHLELEHKEHEEKITVSERHIP
ncbi:MAG: glycosyltransferase family 87 protein [Candidatus Thorarchaeota archaeon]|nr:glycosyltransferase family 87 protein [Candidatus Thorarchaeota archaeon]